MHHPRPISHVENLIFKKCKKCRNFRHAATPGKISDKNPRIGMEFPKFPGGVRMTSGGFRAQNFVKFVHFLRKISSFLHVWNLLLHRNFVEKWVVKTSKKCAFFHFEFLGQRGAKKVENCIIFLLRKKFLRFFAIFLRFFAIFLGIESSPPEGFFEK